MAGVRKTFGGSHPSREATAQVPTLHENLLHDNTDLPASGRQHNLFVFGSLLFTASVVLFGAGVAVGNTRPFDAAKTSSATGLRARSEVSFLDAAEKAIAAAKARAKVMDVPMNIAIVDKFANLVAFSRSEGAWIGSLDIAIRKAVTARSFDMPSADIGTLSQPGGSLYMIEVSNGGLISFGGGFPLKVNDVVVGAIGVSGGAVTEDADVATAGLHAFEATSPPTPPTITREHAKNVMQKALQYALKPACKYDNGDFGDCLHNIAVVDAGGKLMEFQRMDGAWLGSIDIAIKKAKTAAQFCSAGDYNNVLDETLGELSQPGEPLFQIEGSNAGLITFPGGVAIIRGGHCIGAVGASGGTVEADHFVAHAAAQKPFAINTPQVNAGAILQEAVKILDAAEKKAIELKIAQNIVVTDAGGNLVAFTRMTNAWLGSVDIAIKKANTAVKFAMNSGDIGQISDPSKPDESLYAIELSNGGLISFPGGVLVKDTEGGVALGVGVSGSTVEDDFACASAGASAIPAPEAAGGVTQHEANSIIAAATVFVATPSNNITAPFDMCVVDQFLDMVAFVKADGAWRGSIDIACKKARTAVMFNMPSGVIGSISHPKLNGKASGSLYGIEHSNNFASRTDIVSSNAFGAASEPGGLITFGGGKPLVKDGKLIGGFGVSGSAVSEDSQVCDAGVAAL